MGQAASSLTQLDVDEIIAYCGGKLNQSEVEALFDRFQKLDRGRKGFLSRDEFLNIPEVSINPLCTRLVRFFAGVNFKEFANLVSVFTARATREDKVKFMFSVHDMDGDGVISTDDLRLTIQLLAGSSVTERQAVDAAEKVIEEAVGDKARGLTYKEYVKAMKAIPISMIADLNVESWIS